MNRYVAAGLLSDARAGKQVMFVGESQVHARHAFETVTYDVTDETVHRAHGNERIGTPAGGSIRFIGRRSLQRARGQRLDVAYVDCDLSNDELAALLPALPSVEALLR